MRKAFFVALLVALAWAQPAKACKDCDYEFLWPWLEECATCIDINCGFILCRIEQYGPGPNDEHCVLEGPDCNESGNDCPPPSPEFGYDISETLRVARIEVTTPSAPKSVVRRVRTPGKRG